MSTITKEQAKDLRNAFQCWQQDYDPVEDKEQYDMFGLGVVAMDALLASLEAEKSGRNPVLAYADSYRDMAKQGVESIPVWSVITDLERNIAPLYTAPPAPVNAEPVAWLWSHRKHPSEVTLVRPEDDERAEGAHWSGWSCHALYASPPALVSVPDFGALTKCIVQRLVDYGAADDDAIASAEEFVYNACRAAMLQGAENAESTTTMQNAPALDSSPKIAESTSGNSPVIPDGWVACSERMPDKLIPVMVMYADGEMWSAIWTGMKWDDGTEFPDPHAVTHWQEMPAAPQQEVK